jgi:hypothetical protein
MNIPSKIPTEAPSGMLTPTGTPIGSDLDCEQVSQCLENVASCNDDGSVTYCIEPKDGAPDDCKKEWSHIAVYANGLILDGSDPLELPLECTNNLQGKLDVRNNERTTNTTTESKKSTYFLLKNIAPRPLPPCSDPKILVRPIIPHHRKVVI